MFCPFVERLGRLASLCEWGSPRVLFPSDRLLVAGLLPDLLSVQVTNPAS